MSFFFFFYFRFDVQSVLRFSGRELELDYIVNLPSSRRSLYITAGSLVANLSSTNLLLLLLRFIRPKSRCCCPCNGKPRSNARLDLALDLKEQKLLCSFIFPFNLDSICRCLLHLASASFFAWVEFMLPFLFPISFFIMPWGTSVCSYNTYYTL